MTLQFHTIFLNYFYFQIIQLYKYIILFNIIFNYIDTILWIKWWPILILFSKVGI